MKLKTLKITLLTTLSVIMLSGVVVNPDTCSGEPDSGAVQSSSETEIPSGEDGISPLSDLDESRLE